VGVQAFDGKRPHPFLIAGSGNARGTITISGISNPANYYSEYIIYKCSRGAAQYKLEDLGLETHGLINNGPCN